MLKLYPMPVEITEKEGKYEFLYVNVSGIENEVVLNVYSEMGISLSEANAPNVKYVKKEGLQPEEYEIIIDESGAEIAYSADNGAFYGTQTLCQLINMKTVSHLEIKDRPLLKNRQFSLDISRGKLPKMEHFKEIIDYIAMARYNTLCLYYDRIVFQFPRLEGLWEEDSITIEELWQIKKWCNEKFIKLLINVEGFGHLENFLKHDRFRHLSNSLDENKPGMDLNPLDPRSIEFVDDLISDVIDFCDTEYLIVSVDEVRSLASGKSGEEVKKRGYMTVYMEYVNKIYNLVTNKYKRLVRFSGDMYLKRTATDEEIIELLEMFPKNAIAGDWGYESEYEYHRFERNNRLLQQAGIKFENRASTGTFSQYVPRTYNQTLNAEVACRQAYEHGAYGVSTSTWGDDGNSQFFVMELGGLFTFGGTAWNYKGFQLSYSHEFINKYIYKADNCNFAGIVAGFGDAAWYTKGKCPDFNVFVSVEKSVPFTSTLFWNGYHAHTGISSIHIYDMVDEYGCKKALKLVMDLRKELEAAEINCENASLVKEKLLLNVRMFELAIRMSYFKLCVLVTKDFDTAKGLIESVRFCFDEIISSFKKLWLTENRNNGSQIYLNSLNKRKEKFEDYVASVL